jgi:hypothetical protein
MIGFVLTAKLSDLLAGVLCGDPIAQQLCNLLVGAHLRAPYRFGVQDLIVVRREYAGLAHRSLRIRTSQDSARISSHSSSSRA